MSTRKCNNEEHELWDRRSFLKGLGLFGVGSMAFANSSISFAKNTELTAAINNVDNDNILLIIKLFGGNDGLNMIVPVNQYDIYAKHRPTIKIPESNLISLNDDYAMPKFMDSIESMWNEGKVKVVHSAGYENQSLSHFKGSDIWDSADIDSITQSTGWLGRYYDDLHKDYALNPPESPVAIQIGSTRNITFNGTDNKYNYSVANIASLQTIVETGKVYPLDSISDCEYGNNVSFLRNTYNNSFTYAEVIHDAYNRSSDYTGGVGGYPETGSGSLGESLNIIARLIKGNLGTKVYMVTLDGFDTHANQLGTHQNLLTYFSKSISYFHEDLTSAGWGDKILSMAHSEFGRRVAENGSNGTDHGAAGPMMFFGEGLQGSGFIGKHSDLEDLNFGNLKHHTDFRQAYSSVLKNWLCVDPVLVDTLVLGHEFENLDLGFKCENTPIIEEEEEEVILIEEEEIIIVDSEDSFTDNDDDITTIVEEVGEELIIDNEVVAIKTFETFTSFENGDTIINLKSNSERHINLTLHNLSGQQIAILEYNVINSGIKKINLKEKLPNLTTGIYIYKVYSGSYLISKKLVVK